MTQHAPELKGLTDWINSKPLTLAELRGKVVLIDFWAYSCINCIRTQPYLNAWYDKYRHDGLVIIGVHAPEFEFEKIAANVQRAVTDEKIAYPVALDNAYATWQAFDNHYWPAKYLIDQHGDIQFVHFGEGADDEAEHAIQMLLGNDRPMVKGAATTDAWQYEQTPETYLGYERARNFANAVEFVADKPVTYTLADGLASGDWSLGGSWQIGPQGSTSQADSSVLRMQFSAKEVYLVIDGAEGMSATLKLNGRAVTPTSNGGDDVEAGGRVHLDGPRLYRLLKLPVFAKDQTLDITLPKGVTVNAFTFGG